MRIGFILNKSCRRLQRQLDPQLSMLPDLVESHLSPSSQGALCGSLSIGVEMTWSDTDVPHLLGLLANKVSYISMNLSGV